jgi:hypothetical protein
MRFGRVFWISAALFAVLAFGSTARADTFLYDFSNGTTHLSFSTDSNPTPDLAASDFFGLAVTTNSPDPALQSISVFFFDTSQGGGLSFNDSSSGGLLSDILGTFDYAGPTLFSELVPAPTTAPTLLAGTFSLFNFEDPSVTATLTVTDTTLATAAPEPSTWAMMILGFAGIGAVTYRRRKSTALAA